MARVKAEFKLDAPQNVQATVTLTAPVGAFMAGVKAIQDKRPESYEARQLLEPLEKIIREATGGMWNYYEPKEDPESP